VHAQIEGFLLGLDETEAIPIVCAASLRSGGAHELTTEMLACRDVGVTLSGGVSTVGAAPSSKSAGLVLTRFYPPRGG
jgi:hypothetical protein